MAGGFKRIEDYDVVLPADLPDDAVVYVVLPSESTPALIDRNWTWAGFKSWLTSYVAAVAAVVSNTTHRGLSNNPHSVTKSQVGLGVTASPSFNGINTGNMLLKTKVISKVPNSTTVSILHGLDALKIRGLSISSHELVTDFGLFDPSNVYMVFNITNSEMVYVTIHYVE